MHKIKWYYRLPWTRSLMLLYCISCIFVGWIGIVQTPSQAIENQLGSAAVLLYSWILIIAGLLGTIGIFRSLYATVIAIWAIAAATFFHGAAIIAEGSIQTGLRLIISPLMMVPLAWTWMQWLVAVKHIVRNTPKEK